MRVSEFVLKCLNTLVTLVLILGLCVAGAYSVYALWDNRQVYHAADDVQAELLQLKPVLDPQEDSSSGFQELQAINPDVCAWLTLDNTGIDYPVLQGQTNLSYINTDVYGNFALAGSIFLDARNERDFSDAYTLIYGHHMVEHRMFGDLELYADRAFFADNRTGTLILPDVSYRLEIIACMKVASSEPMIFEPEQTSDDIPGLLAFAEENALHLHEDTLAAARGEDAPQILALSTCASEFTDARTIVIALMEPYLPS